MSQYKDSMGNSMDDVKGRVREGLDSAKSAAYDAKDYVNAKMRDARDQLHNVGDDVRHRFDDIRDTDYDEVWDGVKDKVRDNPGPALLLAAAVGLAIGVILAGSSAAVNHRR